MRIKATKTFLYIEDVAFSIDKIVAIVRDGNAAVFVVDGMENSRIKCANASDASAVISEAVDAVRVARCES